MKNVALRYIVSRTSRTSRISHPASHIPHRVSRIPDLARALLLALYAFAVFGYVAATLSTFFIERDAANDDAEIAGAKSIEDLRQEIIALRAEVRSLIAREDRSAGSD